jgi:hypothetical protein
MDLKEYFRETDGKPDMILKVRRTAEEWQWRRLRDLFRFREPDIHRGFRGRGGGDCGG